MAKAGYELVGAPTKAIIETIGDLGYMVSLGVDDDGQNVVKARALNGSERFIVRGTDL